MLFDIDEKLVKQVKKAYACKTKKQAVELALKEALKKKKREEFARKLTMIKIGMTLKDLNKIREAQ